MVNLNPIPKTYRYKCFDPDINPYSIAKQEHVFTGAGGLTVGDWVEVMHDFSPGNNSGGGVGVIIEIVEQFSHVRYIVDRHAEKFVPLTRLTTIPMPYRREKAKLRTRSASSTEPNKGTPSSTYAQ